MANVGDITAGINVRTAGLRRGLASAGRRIRSFTNTSTSGFRRVTSAITRTRGAIILLGGAMAGIGFRKTITAFTEFEDALLDLQKVLSETEGDAKQFIGVAEELSNAFGKSAAEVLQGAANFKQAGFEVQEAFELQEMALRAAIISELDVVGSSKMLIGILKGFKAPASEAGRALDIMNEVSNKYATSLGELSVGMSQLSPIARTMGFTMEETAAVLTPIIEVFGSGSEAAVAMRTSLLRLVSDQSKVKETLEALEVSQKDVNGRLREGRDILFDVMERFQLLDKTQKIFVAGQLVGIRQAARFVEVMDNSSKVLNIHEDALNSAGSAEREQRIRLEALSTQLDITREKFVNMTRRIGAFFAPTVESAAKKIQNFMKALEPGGELRVFVELMKVLANSFIFVASSLASITLAIPKAVAAAIRGLKKFFSAGTNFNRIGKDSRGRKKAGIPDNFPGDRLKPIRADLLGGQDLFASALGAPTAARDNALAKRIQEAVDNLGKAEEEFDKLENKGKTVMESLSSATQGWANNFARDMTDVLFGAEVTFGNIFESFARMLTQMAIQVGLINPILQSAFGAQIPGGTGIGFVGRAKAALGFASGAARVPGPIGAPVPAIVHGGEKIIPVHEARGGSNIEINIIGASEDTRIEEGESANGGRKLDIILDELMAGNTKPGTKFHKALGKNFTGMSPELIRR